MEKTMDKRRHVPSGALILEEGAIGDHAYIIEIGTVDISIQNQYGDEVFLAQLGPGAIIGEMAAILGGDRCASVRAQDVVVLTVVPGAELRASMAACSDMKDYLIALIERRAREVKIALHKPQEKFSSF
jgi:CRP-like cAMP-binding protein